MPDTKLDTMFCRPKPIPTDKAPRDDRKRGEIDPCGCDRDKSGQKYPNVAKSGHHRDLTTGINFCLGQNVVLHRALHGTCQEVTDHEHDDQRKETARADGRIANGNTSAKAGPKLGQVCQACPPRSAQRQAAS